VVGDQGTAYAVDTATEAKVLSEGITPDGKALFLGASPMGVAVTRDEAKVIVANRGSNTVTLIDARKNAVMASIPVGNEPTAVAVQPAPQANVSALPSETRATPCGVVQNPSTPNGKGGFFSHVQLPTATPQVIIHGPLGIKIGLTPFQIGKKAQPNTPGVAGAQGTPNGCGPGTPATGAPATNTSITAPGNR
jgi:YVTN family beta-propeller protein